MLELVREYAAEKLTESGEAALARARHADWYSGSVIGTSAVTGTGHVESTEQLDTEHDNLRAALAWYLGAGDDPERAMDTAASLWRYWWTRGMMSEGLSWLRRCLAAGAEPSPTRVRALRAAAVLARMMLDNVESRRLAQEALDVARGIGDEGAYAACLNSLCATACMQGDLTVALRCGEESVAWAVRMGDRRGVGVSHGNLATVLRCLGRLEESEAMYLSSLEALREAGDSLNECIVLYNLAQAVRLMGHLSRSRDLCLQALTVYRPLKTIDGELDVLEVLACLEVDEGRPRSALRVLTVTARERHRTGYEIPVGLDRETRDQALAATTAALGEKEAREIRAASAKVDVDNLVSEFLAGQARARQGGSPA